MPSSRDIPDRPPVGLRVGLYQSRYVVSSDVLIQSFLDVCPDKQLYYAESTAVLPSNRNFRINRYFTGSYLPYLVQATASLQSPSFML